MAFIVADRVKETSTTNGTGTLDLDGASTGFESFVTGIGNGNTTTYLITDGTEWEVGIGTVTDAATDTLSRDTIIASSNADAAVNWTGGATKDVVCVFSAAGYLEDLILLNTDAGAAVGPILKLERDSASAAADDILGAIRWEGRDDGGNDTIYAEVTSEIEDATDTTEDGNLVVKLMKAGTLTEVFRLTPQATAWGQLGAVQVYEQGASPATWTKPADLKFAVIEVIGGGGAGGGVALTSSSQAAAGGGGGGGGYAMKLAAASVLGATETATIGAGGTGVSGANNGNTGGTSSFTVNGGSTVQATGGDGGVGASSIGTYAGRNGGAGGVGTNGDVNATGNGGTPGIANGDTTNETGTGGTGGASVYGAGGRGISTNGAGTPVAGADYGGGGGGQASGVSQAAAAGAAGGDGVVIVWEYF